MLSWCGGVIPTDIVGRIWLWDDMVWRAGAGLKIPLSIEQKCPVRHTPGDFGSGRRRAEGSSGWRAAARARAVRRRLGCMERRTAAGATVKRFRLRPQFFVIALDDGPAKGPPHTHP